VLVELVDCDVLVGCTCRPQNCTLEMSGRLCWESRGRPEFEKWPLVCDGDSVVMTADGPPLTMMFDTPAVELQSAPSADEWLNVTTCELPDGESNE
jgi:hypothetical protein